MHKNHEKTKEYEENTDHIKFDKRKKKGNSHAGYNSEEKDQTNEATVFIN